MAGGHNFEQRDVLAARNFATTARAAGVQRIIYLGGLGDPNTALSGHLRSRQETGAVLRDQPQQGARAWRHTGCGWPSGHSRAPHLASPVGRQPGDARGAWPGDK